MDENGCTIYSAARLCSSHLEQSLRKAKCASEEISVIEELRGRFNLWAKYVGVFTVQRASLDARLACHPDIKDMIIELLDMIKRNLQWNDLEADDEMESAPASQPGKKGVSSLVNPGLGATEAAIDRLITLGVSIRWSGRQGHQSRYSTDSGIQGESMCSLLVRRRFRHAPKSLCHQIGASIHARGTSLQYIQSHNNKLAHERHFSEHGNVEQEGNAIGMQAQDMDNLEVVHNKPLGDHKANTAIETLPSRVSPSKVARGKRPTGSTISKGSTVQESTEDFFCYPPKPRKIGEGKYISCTLCSEPLEEAHLTDDAWKAHVDRDIEPYICMSAECREPLRFFVRKQDWMEHMQTRHTMSWSQKIHTERWYCDTVHDEPMEFDKKESFISHMEIDHAGSLSKSQIQGRARRNRRSAVREPFVCPLCDCVPEDLVSFIDEKPFRKLSEHIAQHLKSLSFLSLSYVQDSLDDGQSVTETPEESRVTGYAERFEDSRSSQDIPSLDDTAVHVNDVELEQRIGEETVVPDSEPESWSFLPVKDLSVDFLQLKIELTHKNKAHTDLYTRLLDEREARVERREQLLDSRRRMLDEAEVGVIASETDRLQTASMYFLGKKHELIRAFIVLDTGCEFNVISSRLWEEIKSVYHELDRWPEGAVTIQGLHGASIGIARDIHWSIVNGSELHVSDFLIHDMVEYDAIIGWREIEENQLLPLEPSKYAYRERSQIQRSKSSEFYKNIEVESHGIRFHSDGSGLPQRVPLLSSLQRGTTAYLFSKGVIPKTWTDREEKPKRSIWKRLFNAGNSK